MAKSLGEYIEFVHDKDDLWPKPPALEKPLAKPSVGPLPGIRVVLWSVYGTLVRIGDGEFLHDHPQRLRMQVALEKTVQEFNMWNSMYRTEQQPWEYMYERWTKALEDARLAGTGRKGDLPALDSAKLWRQLVAQLEKKEYEYDRSVYGDEDELAEKIAYFFHAKLQGVEAAPAALETLRAVADSGREQGLVGDAQAFTIPQLLRLLATQGAVPPLGELFRPELLALSHQVGSRRPSPVLWERVAEGLESRDVTPAEAMLVSNDFANDLGPAKKLGFKTALYAGDKLSLRATAAELKDTSTRPDRLIVDLAQVRQILKIA